MVDPDRPQGGPPGGVFFMAPGASFGGSYSHSTIEVKGAISSLVMVPVPGTVLVREGGVVPLDGHHLTIHDNLMVHLKRNADDSAIELSGPAIIDGTLVADAIHLVTLAASPPEATLPHIGRSQSTWSGGSAIISVAPDEHYNPVTTHLLVDVWATRTDFNIPGRLPAPSSTARAAVMNNGSSVLVVGAEWGFRSDPQPQCLFVFRCWYADTLEFGGAPFIATRRQRKFSAVELMTFTPKPLEYEIRGWDRSVTIVFGSTVFRLSLAEAEALADSVAGAVDAANGAATIPVIVANQKFGFTLPIDEAVKVPGYIRSAIEYARKNGT